MDEFGRIVERSGLGVFEEVGGDVKGSTGVERSIAVQGSIAVEGSTVGFTKGEKYENNSTFRFLPRTVFIAIGHNVY
jgi:hypothetical protein